MNVISFRGHVEQLLKRVGRTDAFLRIRAIRNCLPQKFKEKVDMVESEEEFWKAIHWRYMTMEIYFVERQVTCFGCRKAGHSMETCRSTQKKDGP